MKRRETARHLQQCVCGAAHARPARTFSASPRDDQPIERRTVAEVSGVAQRTIERGHLVWRQRRLVWSESEMRGPQKCDCRAARKIAADECEDQVDRGGKGSDARGSVSNICSGIRADLKTSRVRYT